MINIAFLEGRYYESYCQMYRYRIGNSTFNFSSGFELKSVVQRRGASTDEGNKKSPNLRRLSM